MPTYSLAKSQEGLRLEEQEEARRNGEQISQEVLSRAMSAKEDCTLTFFRRFEMNTVMERE